MSERYLPLSAVSPGEQAEITSLNTLPPMRRRLLELGLIPGTAVRCLFRGPSGDPAAFSVRGAVIALRNRDSRTITVRRLPERRQEDAEIF